MTQFTQFRDQAHSPRPSVSVERLTALDHAEDRTTQNAMVCAIFIMLYTDYFLATHVYEDSKKFDHDRFWYNKKFKTSTENFISAVSTHDNQICRMFKKKFPGYFEDGFADLCDSIDEDITPEYNALKDALKKKFVESGLERADDFTIIYGMGTLAVIAKMVEDNLCKAIPALSGNFDRYVSISRVIYKANLMMHYASEKTPSDTRINLDRDLLIHSKVHRMTRMFTNHDVFARAFKAGGFTLELDEEELKRMQRES